jgi:hypothetical protein
MFFSRNFFFSICSFDDASEPAQGQEGLPYNRKVASGDEVLVLGVRRALAAQHVPKGGLLAQPHFAHAMTSMRLPSLSFSPCSMPAQRRRACATFARAGC